MTTPPPIPTPSSTTGRTSTSSRFRMQGKRFFLTFPQCLTTKEQAATNLKGKWPVPEPLSGYVIAEEAHADGTPHLHLLLTFTVKMQFYSPDVFDFIGGKHGNYQTARSLRGTLEYVTKKGVYCSEGLDVKSLLSKKGNKSTEMALLCKEGKTLEEINDLDPGYVLNNKRKLEEYLAWTSLVAMRNEKRPWVPLNDDDGHFGSPEDYVIAGWLNENIKQRRKFKGKQLYVWGPPNTGKTTMVNQLNKRLSVYFVPRDEDFYDGYRDAAYDLAVLDEFTHTKTMQWLNQFLDGQTMTLRIKGGQVVKKDNIPVIILSNYPPEVNYSKLFDSGKLTPLLERLLVVEVSSFVRLFK